MSACRQPTFVFFSPPLSLVRVGGGGEERMEREKLGLDAAGGKGLSCARAEVRPGC